MRKAVETFRKYQPEISLRRANKVQIYLNILIRPTIKLIA